MCVCQTFVHRCQLESKLKPPSKTSCSTFISPHETSVTTAADHKTCTHNLSSPILTKRCSTPQVHRTSKSLIASIGVDSEWTHAQAAAAATPATAYLNADLWYRCCLLPAEHEFLYRTPALCSNASYSQANVPVTIVLSSKVRGAFCFCQALLLESVERRTFSLFERLTCV